eukprot:scaffold13020_cov54-Phaeocystis_antarctica.AAC.2
MESTRSSSRLGAGSSPHVSTFFLWRVPLLQCDTSVFWANDSVGKNKGGDTTTRTGIETAGSLKDLGFWLWPSFGPWEPAAANAAPYASEGPHPSPAASPAIVEEPRVRTESRCASEERRAAVACVTVGRGHVEGTRLRRRRGGGAAAGVGGAERAEALATGGGAERTSAIRVLARTTVAWSDIMKITRRWLASWPEPPASRSATVLGTDAEQSGEHDGKESAAEPHAAGKMFLVLFGGARDEERVGGDGGDRCDPSSVFPLTIPGTTEGTRKLKQRPPVGRVLLDRGRDPALRTHTTSSTTNFGRLRACALCKSGEDRFVHDTRAAGVRRAAAGVLAPAPAVPGSALLALVALSDATEAAAVSAAGRRRNKVVALLVVLVVSTDRGFFLSTVYGKQGPAYSLRLVTSFTLLAFKLRASTTASRSPGEQPIGSRWHASRLAPRPRRDPGTPSPQTPHSRPRPRPHNQPPIPHHANLIQPYSHRPEPLRYIRASIA